MALCYRGTYTTSRSDLGCLGIRVLVDLCVLGVSKYSLGMAIAPIECVSWVLENLWVLDISRHSLGMAMAHTDASLGLLRIYGY